ncbi:MAG TPA: ferrochelatase [Terriglobales bacterium]|nr:ferrochelatase [Terriglobales bacterium]
MPVQRLGVVLFQLGGPDTLETIEPFLYNLFCDPDIIDFPFARVARKPLARMIASTRARKVQHHYAVIGGGSPIRRHTEAQARALESLLQAAGLDARCFVAMRYWHPFITEAVAQVQAAGCDRLVLLPLYPQYSGTTTGSSLNEWRRQWCGRDARQSVTGDGLTAVSTDVPSAVVREFYRNKTYLAALAEKVDRALSRFGNRERVSLVFSAHSLPLSVIEKGDPYQRQIEETVSLLMEQGGWPNPHRLCYQSKVGASKWLQPSLRATLRELGASGATEVCVVPVSFVSDHVETLGEIDHEARELAATLGIQRFEMTEGLNDSPRFIGALAELVLGAVPCPVRQGSFPLPQFEMGDAMVAAD